MDSDQFNKEVEKRLMDFKTIKTIAKVAYNTAKTAYKVGKTVGKVGNQIDNQAKKIAGWFTPKGK